MDEVERLLQHPEDLKRLPNMLEEYTQKHHANKVQLSATVASQVDAARSGMELLESAQKTLAKMQQCFDVRFPSTHPQYRDMGCISAVLINGCPWQGQQNPAQRRLWAPEGPSACAGH